MVLRRHIKWKFLIVLLLLLASVFLIIWEHVVCVCRAMHWVSSAENNASRLCEHGQRCLYSEEVILENRVIPSVSTAAPPPEARKTSNLCEPEHPCQYNDKVDLRIIIMTFKRPKSLLTLLNSLNSLELDNQSAVMEIWIDRSRMTNRVHQETVTVASQFQWSRGPTRVHIHKTHVGLYGQWINTWRPPDNSDEELAMFLEDDLSVSKYAYRWARAVFRAYGERTDFAGASLVGYQMEYLSVKPKRNKLAGPKNHTVFMHKCFGWWGFVPKPVHWKYFQVWISINLWKHSILGPE